MSAAFDARLGPHAEAPVKPHLNQPVDPRFALGILAVLALGLFYMAYSIRTDIADAGRRTDDDPAVHSARRRVADRARLRIRQRLPRHRQRGRHRHLHPRPAGAGRGRMVGVLESPRRPGFDRRGGLRHRLAAAGRAHSSGRLRRRLRDGVCAAHFRDHLEPGHLVARHSRFELAHPDRVDRRRRRRQRAHPRPERHGRRGLGPGHQGRRGAPVLAAVRLCPFGAAAARDEGRHPRAGALHRPDHQQAAVALDPRVADPHLHAGLVLPRLQRRSEGHGPHHADPDRRRADRLCAQPRAGRRSRRPVRLRRARRFEDRRSPWRRIQCHRRSPPGGDGIHSFAHDLGRHLSVARGPDQADQRLGRAIWLRRQDAARQGPEPS